MTIRIRNIDQASAGTKGYDIVNLGVIPVGTTQVPCFVAPVDCVVETIAVYPINGFSANTSDTLQLSVQNMGASGTIVSRFTISTSAASHAYSSGQQILLSATANNSLTAGFALFLQVSAVCQAVMSQTVVMTTYRSLFHRNNR